MKVRASVKKICDKCKVIHRRGVVRVRGRGSEHREEREERRDAECKRLAQKREASDTVARARSMPAPTQTESRIVRSGPVEDAGKEMEDVRRSRPPL